MGAWNGGSWLGCRDLPAMEAEFYLGAGWPQWKPLGVPGTHLPLKRGSWLIVYFFAIVGYSTCHWCHVMERESFESEEIAQILNEKFVSVKVDREERPDVDKVYMTYIQVITVLGLQHDVNVCILRL